MTLAFTTLTDLTVVLRWTRTRTGLELRTGLGLVHSKTIDARLLYYLSHRVYIQVVI